MNNPESRGNDKPDDCIAIALSGGGARAIAFHLGCLSALNEIGLLQRCSVMSCVSGGSILGAMYSIHKGNFEEFEKKVRQLLKDGLHCQTMKMCFSKSVMREVLLSYLGYYTCNFLNKLQRNRYLKNFCNLRVMSQSNEKPFYSTKRAFRTTALEKTLDNLLFEGRKMTDIQENKPIFVAQATELRTGSAFYFSSHACGGYRFGTIDPKDIRIAMAVTASAAHPLFFPVLDETFEFNDSEGKTKIDTVNLTDGGIYDNLGLSVLWPDRDHKMSISVPKPNVIISCRASDGPRKYAPGGFLHRRLKNSFYTSMERVQNYGLKRLYELKESGKLNAIVLPFLGQNDQRLKCPPDNLVKREEVINYPTDLKAMPEEWTEKLFARGYQLTLAVILEHNPELIT